MMMMMMMIKGSNKYINMLNLYQYLSIIKWHPYLVAHLVGSERNKRNKN
jgi:hypothetical protein